MFCDVSCGVSETTFEYFLNSFKLGLEKEIVSSEEEENSAAIFVRKRKSFPM